MHPIFLVSLSALALSTAPALARERDQPDQTITGREVNARGVAKMPMTDLEHRQCGASQAGRRCPGQALSLDRTQTL